MRMNSKQVSWSEGEIRSWRREDRKNMAKGRAKKGENSREEGSEKNTKKIK